MYDVFDSPIGKLYLRAENGRITGLVYTPWDIAPSDGSEENTEKDDAAICQCKIQLGEYFRGERRAFEIEHGLSGTEFRKGVWAALMTIPYGHTRSYSYIAEIIGKPLAVRAVGGANHNNPISIIIPCHRVIGADGSLTGYGGGLDAKKWLLEHERRVVNGD